MEQKKNYDSAFCGSLPLHLINLIQPYGLLLVLKKSDFTIVQVSENIETFTGLSPQQVVNQPLSQFIAPAEYEKLTNKFSGDIAGKLPVRITFLAVEKQINFLALVQAKDDCLLVELEETGNAAEGKLFTDLYQEVKYAMAEINIAETVVDVSNRAIAELKRISGFDKIMVYKFDEDWNGEVIAETIEEGLDSYLGLHFPASDIPKQARALYLKNPYRLIPTRDYVPVKLYPVINPLTETFLDLGNCNIRSVPTVHIEYLKNMGVTASMSTAIIKDEQLWGLISCHHKTAKHLSYELYSVFELMGGIISNRINSLEHKEQLQLSSKLQQVRLKLMEQIYLDDNPVTGIFNYETNILDLLECNGAVMLYQKKFKTMGKVPDRYEIQDLVLWLQSNNIDALYTSANFPAMYDSAVAYAAIASGIIVLPIHMEKGEYIIGFRGEVVQSVDWGGNPNEAINFEKNNTTYHPRNSFKIWKQTLQCTSLPWLPNHLAIAESFRNFLIEYTLKKVYATM
ncbi:MAG TPA: GAF domain-containing protein [Segetibacter sp.]|jgi:light-regulated signal transduction histidine kinase (bacteriophytochrome)